MKKRDKIFITVIILTVIIAVLVVVLFYLNSRNKMKLWSNSENEQVNQFEEEVSMIQKQAKEKYPNFKWLSDGNLGKIQVGVEDKKVYMKVNQDGSKTYIDFDKGTPKYASSVLRGGMLEEVFVITTDGKLYIANGKNYGNDNFEHNFNFEFYNLGYRVINATYANGEDMYYLLEDGRLVSKDLNEYVK